MIPDKTAEKLQKRLKRQLAVVSNHHAVILDLIERLKAAEADSILTAKHPAPYSAIETIRTPGAKGTYVAFSSLGNETGLIRAEYQGVLRETGDNIIFVKDFLRLWFQKGMFPHTKSRRQTARALNDILQHFPRPWRFVGSSAGGYAALYFGALLGADHIHAFAPQTQITPRAFNRFTYLDPKDTEFDIGDPENDLARVFEAVPMQGNARLYYGAQNTMDSTQAKHLSDTPNITLVPLDERTHHIAYHLRKTGELLKVLTQ